MFRITLWLVLSAACQNCMGNRMGSGGGSESTSDVERYNLTPMRRLTATQYANSVTDLFGSTLLLPKLQVVDVSLDNMPTAGAAQVSISTSDAQAYTNAAASIARQVASEPIRDTLGCAPKTATDPNCAAEIISTLGTRIFRRPLSAAQQQAYVALATASMQGNFWNGIQAAVGAMLQSPYFLFRLDVGVGTGSDPNAFDDYTLASRLSYLIWNSTPDAALLAAADAGSLHTATGLSAQADRLLADPRANPALYNFFNEMLGLSNLATAQKDPNVFTPALAATLQQQIALTITDVLLVNDGDYRTLFTTPRTFVNTQLAQMYGYSDPATSTLTQITYTSQDRAGLFGLPGMTTMLSPSSRTSPTKRGNYIRSTLLCTTIPAAPANVNTTVTQDPNMPQTMRQLMSAHAANPACSSCHALMDPIGFGLEDFDWLGRYQTTENGLPLDLTGTLDSTASTNATTLGAAIGQDPALPGCLTQRFVAYATAQVRAPNDPMVTSLASAFASQNYSIKALVKAYVLSNAFTHP